MGPAKRSATLDEKGGRRRMIRVMDLFSGIGGFSIGLKRAGGYRTVAYCEIDVYCQRVLLSRMRDGSLDTAPICGDVRCLDGKPWAGRVDLICGGFPCQDISDAGELAGIDGERSGLWREFARLVRQVGPAYVIVENVAALLHRGMERVLGDLAEIGYDAEWECIPASAVGAPHRRDRVWIVAYPAGLRRGWWATEAGWQARRPTQGYGKNAALADAKCDRLERIFKAGPASGPAFGNSDWWKAEPGVGRVADGIPNWVDRIKGLGNAVVPQVVEWIGRQIMKDQS